MSKLHVTLYSLIFLFIAACQDNYDESMLIEEEFSPQSFFVDEGDVELHLSGCSDSLLIILDSNWVSKLDYDATIYGFTPIGSGNNYDHMITNFSTDYNDLILTEGIHPVTELEIGRFIWNGTDVDTIFYYHWIGNQLDVDIEIVEAEEEIDPIFNLPRNQITGFIYGTATDADGMIHNISAAFNEVKQ
jgi:hypothetical protein